MNTAETEMAPPIWRMFSRLLVAASTCLVACSSSSEAQDPQGDASQTDAAPVEAGSEDAAFPDSSSPDASDAFVPPAGSKHLRLHFQAGVWGETSPGKRDGINKKGQVGHPEDPWNQRVDGWPVSPDSKDVVDYMHSFFKPGGTYRSKATSEFFAAINLAMEDPSYNPGGPPEIWANHVLEANAATQKVDWLLRLTTNGFKSRQWYSNGCDAPLMPVPKSMVLDRALAPRIQGAASMDCNDADFPEGRATGIQGAVGEPYDGGDCHLVVAHFAEGKAYEMWRSDEMDGELRKVPGETNPGRAGGCVAIWDFTKKQHADLRGKGCTSADAAGLAFTPMLVTPGEIAEGRIEHAMRLTFQNPLVKKDLFVPPATHNPITYDIAAAGPGKQPLYGSRFRLKASVQCPSITENRSQHVICVAAKEYGVIHSDGGGMQVAFSSDYADKSRWTDPEVSLGVHDFTAISPNGWQDWELVSDYSKATSMKDVTCTRTDGGPFIEVKSP